MITRYPLILSSVLFLPALVLAQPAAKIQFSKESYDHGEIRYGLKKEAKFEFTNAGDATLVINKVRSSCGCTQVLEGSKEVSPGSKGKIVATLDTESLTVGKKKKTIYVHTNDPERPIVQLTLLANVVRKITVDPPSLTKALPEFQEEITFPMQISNSSEKPVTVTGIDVQGSSVAAHLRPKEIVVQPRAKVSVELVLKLSKEEKWSYRMGSVKLKVDDPVEKQIDVRYFVKIGDKTKTSSGKR